VSRQEEGDATIDHSCTNCGYTTLSMVTLNELKDLATAALES
jgi:hypothetical protein